MSGAATPRPPRDSIAAIDSPHCAIGRQTAIVSPASGRRPNQSSVSRSRTHSPTTMSEGGCSPASKAIVGSSPIGPDATRCSGSEAFETTAAGVAASRPAAMSSAAISGSR